jgi:asparagine synthetase B (glutamine-hydrolysing)
MKHLRGMFAFAIWDKGKRQLFAARDRLGTKPFYYRFDSTFLFGSEIKATLAHPSELWNVSTVPCRNNWRLATSATSERCLRESAS